MTRPKDLDCRSHSCLYAINRTGMRTNGRCTCADKLLDEIAAQREEIRKLRLDLEHFEQLQSDLDQAKQEITIQRLALVERSETITQLQSDLDHAKGAVQRFVRGEDKLCLMCGAQEPCELKNDPASPCMFEPTPMELVKECQRLRRDLDQVLGEAIVFAKAIKLYDECGFLRTDAEEFLTSPLVHAYRARQWRWATYLGANDSQVAFGGNTDPRSYLTVGRRYQVDRVVVHDSVTDVYLKGYPGKGFNSVCFDLDIADDLEAWRARQRKERE